MNYYYSASVNAFYDNELYSVYVEAGNWPEDCKEVPDDIFSEFATGQAPAGKVRVGGMDGLPAWGDIPPTSNEAMISIVTDQKKTLMQAAALAISPLQDAVYLGIATAGEKLKLTSWMEYRVALNRIEEQDNYPNEIQWPVSPGGR